MPNYDPNNQNSWVQPVNPNQEPWSTQQGGQTGQEPWSTREGERTGREQGSQWGGSPVPPGTGQVGQGGGIVGGVTTTVRQDVENQIYGLIDHYASQVPGGHMFAPEAKQAVAGALDGLQQKLENQAQSRLSGMGGGLGGRVEGGLFGNEPNNSGGQL